MDILESVMRHYGEPLTRENYFKLKHAGKPPSGGNAEEEEGTPKRFQNAFPTHEEVKAEEDKKTEGKDAAAKSKPKPVPPPVYKPSREIDPVYPNPRNIKPEVTSDTSDLYMPDASMNRAPRLIARPTDAAQPDVIGATRDTSNPRGVTMDIRNNTTSLEPTGATDN